MRFKDALAVLDRHPSAVMVHNKDRTDKSMQYCLDKGILSWTCAFTVGGVVRPKQYEELCRANSEGWEVYPSLQSFIPLE